MAKIAATRNSSKQVVRVPHGGLVQTIKALPEKENDMVTQAEFWPLWASFFEKGDVVLSEIGTSSFGLLDVKMPPGADLLVQILWGSIGWATGATLGAALAAREQDRRCVLFAGDGSIILSIQEISTMIRNNLKPIIVWVPGVCEFRLPMLTKVARILNNDGYCVERMIHGEHREYNKIGNWQWQKLLDVFGPDPGSYATYKTSTRQELEDLLHGSALKDGSKLHLVECVLGRMDCPRALKAASHTS